MERHRRRARLMGPEDIADIVEASDPRVAPDGQTIAYVVTTPDLVNNLYKTAIWTVGLDGDLPPTPFTGGDSRASKPRWSPDGTRIAYVARPDDRGAVLVVSDVETEETLELVAWPEDIEELSWTPDSERVVFVARERDEAQYAPEKDRDRPPRKIDRLQYRLEPFGWTIDRPKHLFVVAADGRDDGVARALTSGPFNDTGVSVSPDGAWVLFSSARTETWDTDLSTHVYRVPLEGSAAPQQLTGGTTTHGQPAWNPNGTSFAFVWGDRHSMPRHGQIGVVDATAAVPANTEGIITAPIGLHCAPYLASARDPVWDGDGAVLFQVDAAGNVPLYRAFLDGRAAEVVVDGDRQVTGFDLAGGTLAFTATTPTLPSDVYVLVDGQERRLTSCGRTFASKHTLDEPERFVATSDDGTEVEGWLLRPARFSAAERYPVLLNIHGGPFAQYGNRLFDEFRVQTGAGYAVIYANPRGSSGYSEPFARAIRGPHAKEDPGSGWGGVDYDDLMAVVDEALRRFDFLDEGRVGAIGGSYGGYMTSWVIGHTDRFKAAVSERALNNMVTFAHTSDIGAHFPAGYLGATHLDDPDEFVRQSPTTYWHDITTPVMILHSENDLRCPIEQAEDLYVRLKLAGRDVEFVRFPGEGHELTRSGAPNHRVERHRIVIDWFDRKLR
jgi:dipeptidyl aminopeptidase/acylaminoacyl peptidase